MKIFKKVSILAIVFSFIGITAHSQESGKIKKSTKPVAEKSTNTPPKATRATVNEAKKVSPAKTASVKQTSSNEVGGFPKKVDTGNPELDEKKYYEAKKKWYAENPDKAEKLNNTTNGVQTVSKARFDSLPQDRKQYILNNPDRFKIVD